MSKPFEELERTIESSIWRKLDGWTIGMKVMNKSGFQNRKYVDSESKYLIVNMTSTVFSPETRIGCEA